MRTTKIMVILVFALGLIASVANADFTFGTPKPLGPPINQGPHFASFEGDWDANISADGLSLYFASERPGGIGYADLWMATRPTTEDPWDEPVNLGGPVNSASSDYSPNISADGLSLYFDSLRGGGRGSRDIWVSTRVSTDSSWSTPVNLGSSINSPQWDCGPSISADGLTLYFDSNRTGGEWEIWKATRPSLNVPWSEATVEPLQNVNSPKDDCYPRISADGLSLYFASDREGTYGLFDLYVATRSSVEGPWDDPVNLGDILNTPYTEYAPSISSDGLSLYFNSGSMLFVATRQSISEPFGPPAQLSSGEERAHLSADGLALYFASDRAGGVGYNDIWVAYRDSREDPWQDPVNLGPTVNSNDWESAPSISLDGLNLYFSSEYGCAPGDYDLFVSTRTSLDDPWDTTENLGPVVNSDEQDYHPTISGDGLTLIFGSRRPGYGRADLWMTTRKSLSEPWSQPENLGPTINTEDWDYWPSLSADGQLLFYTTYRTDARNQIMLSRRTDDGQWGPPCNLARELDLPSIALGPTVSPDGSTLYFWSWVSEGLGGSDIWEMEIVPVVDLNGDGMVDDIDLCSVVDNWDTDNPSCDFGPMPWGDGIVDVEDLIVLAEHLFEEVDDPTLVAHWALDEIEGDIASDSANDNDGTVYGDPTWQPEGGMVDGALELDGIDDYVSTPFVLNPADGKFSVFAWIKGGAPGQVIVAQRGIADWLVLDAEGKLMTELKDSDGLPVLLASETVVTNEQWHRVGLVWDGSRRVLSVDDVVVAEDMLTGLRSSYNGLYIGGKYATPSSFFSGLIDDVRIYNRAVTP